MERAAQHAIVRAGRASALVLLCHGLHASLWQPIFVSKSSISRLRMYHTVCRSLSSNTYAFVIIERDCPRHQLQQKRRPNQQKPAKTGEAKNYTMTTGSAVDTDTYICDCWCNWI